jgi:hypothetical protein
MFKVNALLPALSCQLKTQISHYSKAVYGASFNLLFPVSLSLLVLLFLRVWEREEHFQYSSNKLK